MVNLNKHWTVFVTYNHVLRLIAIVVITYMKHGTVFQTSAVLSTFFPCPSIQHARAPWTVQCLCVWGGAVWVVYKLVCLWRSVRVAVLLVTWQWLTVTVSVCYIPTALSWPRADGSTRRWVNKPLSCCTAYMTLCPSLSLSLSLDVVIMTSLPGRAWQCCRVGVACLVFHLGQ